MENVKQKVKELIANGETAKALDILDDSLNGLPSHESLILIKGENRQTQNLRIQNTISEEESQRRTNRTNSAIIAIVDQIDAEKEKPRVETKGKSQLNKNFLKIAFILLPLFICACYFYSPMNTIPKIDNDERIAELVLEELAVGLYPDYQDVYLNDVQTKASEVRLKSKSLIKQLSIIEDDDIQLHSKIYKHNGLVILKMILALTTDMPNEQKKYSEQTLRAVTDLEQYISAIVNLEDKDLKIALNNWIEGEKYETRALVNKFLTLAVNYRAGGFVTKEELVITYMKLKEDKIITEEGYDNYPIVKWLLEEKIIEI